MIPSRGLRWSSQTIGIGRRRLEPFSAKQFSSSFVESVAFRPSPLISKNGASASRASVRSQFRRTNILIRNGAGIRFASTTPIEISSAASDAPTEAIGSAAPTSEPFFTTALDNATDFTSDVFINVPEQLGFLKYMGLDYGWGPTAVMEWLLEHIHVLAGTPWWVSIILTSVAVRAIFFKAFMNASDNAGRMAAVKPVTLPLTQEMQAAQMNGNTDKVLQLRQELQMINSRAGIKMLRSFIPMLQIFTGYGSFVLLRGMSKLPVPGLETGGVLWFYNLTIPDPYFILPIATSAMLWQVLRKGGETGTTPMSAEMTKIVGVVLPAISFLFTFWLPAAVQVSFLTTGVLSYLQGNLFRHPAFRQRFGLYPLSPPPQSGGPSTPSPYSGTINVRARQEPLSQEKLDSTYIKPSATEGPEFKQMLKDSKIPGPFKKLVGGTVDDLKGTFKGVKESTAGMTDTAREYMEKRKVKADKAAVINSEKKRLEEEKLERWEVQAQKRAERRAKKAEKRS